MAQDIIKGYQVCNVTKKQVTNEDFVKEIKEKDKKIADKITKTLEEHGDVVGVKKDKVLKAVYLFSKETKEDNSVLKLENSVIVDEITDEMKELLEEQILELYKENVALEDNTKVIFGDKELVPKTVKIGKKEVALGGVIFAIGTLFGVLFMGDDWYLGMCIGLCLGIGCTEITKRK